MTTTQLAAIAAAGTAVVLAPLDPAAVRLAVDPDAQSIDPEAADLIARIDAVDATIRWATALIAADAATPAVWERLGQAWEARGRLEDWLLGVFGAAPRDAEPAPASQPAAPAPAPDDEPLTAASLPRTLHAARERLAAAEDALWAHAEDCGDCFDAAGGRAGAQACWTGLPLWQARNAAADTVNSWREYQQWFRGGGLADYLANDWIA